MLWKDVIIELRTKDSLAAMLMFGILTLAIFNFAFELRADSLLLVAPGVMWVAILFAGVLGLGRSYSHERERGSMEGILLCPVDGGVVYLSKFLTNLLFIGLSEVVLVPAFSEFFDVDALRGTVIAVIMLGTVGFAAVGALFGAMAVNTRAREVMLPVLLLPILVPLVIASVKATGLLLDGEPWSEIWNWASILIVFDIVCLVVSYVVYEYVLEDWG
jgi:heme exporter protein B